MIIGGQEVNSKSNEIIEIYNPYTGELLGTVPSATKEDVDLAIENAITGQKQWGALRADEREKIINKFLSILDERSEDLAVLLSKEGGKTISECRSEINSVNLIFKAYIHAAATLYGKTLPHNIEPRNTGDVIFTTYEPLGVCVCIAPFNYPISTMTNKIAPALCAGNSVIMKPASDTPMATILFAQMMLEAGMPNNTVQVITGSGSKIGKWITENKKVAAISLTGSTEVGVDLQKNASKYLQHIMLELGGNDPLIIFDDCNLEKAVDQTIAGRIYNSGQICSASKRFLVHNSIKDKFAELLVKKISSLKFGDPLDEEVVSSCCMINEKAADTVENQIRKVLEAGAKCIYGGQRNKNIIMPTVLIDVTPEMDIAKDEELFAPVFPIIGFDTFEEAIRIANNTIYGLSAGVMTENIQTALKAAYNIESGTCVINGTGDYRTSYHGFGGYKMSGVGREGASETLKEFSNIKTVVFRDIL